MDDEDDDNNDNEPFKRWGPEAKRARLSFNASAGVMIRCPYPGCKEGDVPLSLFAEHALYDHNTDSQKNLSCPICLYTGRGSDHSELEENLLMHIADGHKMDVSINETVTALEDYAHTNIMRSFSGGFYGGGSSASASSGSASASASSSGSSLFGPSFVPHDSSAASEVYQPRRDSSESSYPVRIISMGSFGGGPTASLLDRPQPSDFSSESNLFGLPVPTTVSSPPKPFSPRPPVGIAIDDDDEEEEEEEKEEEKNGEENKEEEKNKEENKREEANHGFFSSFFNFVGFLCNQQQQQQSQPKSPVTAEPVATTSQQVSLFSPPLPLPSIQPPVSTSVPVPVPAPASSPASQNIGNNNNGGKNIERVDYTLDKNLDGECIICFMDMEKGQSVTRLECMCVFHTDCINSWFKKERECPTHRK